MFMSSNQNQQSANHPLSCSYHSLIACILAFQADGDEQVMAL